MGSRGLLVALCSTCVFALSVTAATAATPTQYRAKLNAMCRGYGAKMRPMQNQLQVAVATQDAKTIGYALGYLMALTLKQDAAVRAEPIPIALRPKMVPTVRLLARGDALIGQILGDGKANNVRGMLLGLQRLQTLTVTINKRLDAAGLHACGSAEA